jgi:excisionase family DNA binding protein
MNNELIVQKLESIEKLLSEQNVLKKEILTVEEAANYLDVSLSHIYKLTYARIIPCYKPNGKKIYFRKSEVDEWMLKNRYSSSEEIDRKSSDYLLQNKKTY